jgi:hypothetical protein
MPAFIRSLEKGRLYSTATCRSRKKKFEPTRFVKMRTSSPFFFARATVPHRSAVLDEYN